MECTGGQSLQMVMGHLSSRKQQSKKHKSEDKLRAIVQGKKQKLRKMELNDQFELAYRTLQRRQLLRFQQLTFNMKEAKKYWRM